jgi:hypothetical protein
VLRLLALTGCVLVFTGDASAKDFVAVVLVGADGRSVEARPAPRTTDSLFDLGVREGRRVAPRGGYMKIYPITDGGFPGAPGRYYPAVRAACMSWSQAGARPHGQCFRVGAALRKAFDAGRHLILFRGPPTSLKGLTHGAHAVPIGSNVGVGVDLAFARWRLRRAGTRSVLCNEFQATWTGPESRQRPSKFCLDPQGIVAKGWLYPLPRSIFELSLQYP